MNLLNMNESEIKEKFRDGEIKIVVFGLCKMGLPLAAVFADRGARVIGVDTDEERVRMINSGINPVKEEHGLDKLVKKRWMRKNYPQLPMALKHPR